MKRLSVVVVNPGGIMNQIVSDILEAQSDIAVRQVQAGAFVTEGIGEPDPDVVILEQRDRPGSETIAPLLATRPRVKVLAITDEGRESYLYELRPHEVALGELSAAALLAAVRGSAAHGAA